jgi:hypothetical protein
MSRAIFIYQEPIFVQKYPKPYFSSVTELYLVDKGEN